MTDHAPITDAEMSAMEERANAATDGPWERHGHCVDAANDDMHIYDEGGHGENDAEFIAHARTDVPRLIAEVKQLRRELAKYQSAYDLSELDCRGEVVFQPTNGTPIHHIQMSEEVSKNLYPDPTHQPPA